MARLQYEFYASHIMLEREEAKCVKVSLKYIDGTCVDRHPASCATGLQGCCRRTLLLDASIRKIYL